jgi:PAS domain S-box-containing protein
VDDSAASRLAQSLRDRQGSIAEAWYTAVARTSFSPFSPAELRRLLFELTSQAIDLMFLDSLEPAKAVPIGAALAGFHFTQPEALGRTQTVLARALLQDLAAEQGLALRPNLIALLEGVAEGFVQEISRVQLREQESIRNALLSELGAAEQRLREARDHLEEEVAKRTEELRESEQRWRTLVSSAPDPVLTIDREGRVQFVNYINPESGVTLEQQLGRRVVDIVIPEQREMAAAVLENAFATGANAVVEAALRRPNGTVVWYAAHMGPLWHDGQVVAVLLVARDITERKRVEEMKDNLLRDVSHELRAPLAKAQMSLELQLEKLEADWPDWKDALRYGRVALGNVQKLAQTVEVILDLSRL